MTDKYVLQRASSVQELHQFLQDIQTKNPEYFNSQSGKELVYLYGLLAEQDDGNLDVMQYLGGHIENAISSLPDMKRYDLFQLEKKVDTMTLTIDQLFTETNLMPSQGQYIRDTSTNEQRNMYRQQYFEQNKQLIDLNKSKLVSQIGAGPSSIQHDKRLIDFTNTIRSLTNNFYDENIGLMFPRNVFENILSYDKVQQVQSLLPESYKSDPMYQSIGDPKKIADKSITTTNFIFGIYDNLRQLAGNTSAVTNFYHNATPQDFQALIATTNMIKNYAQQTIIQQAASPSYQSLDMGTLRDYSMHPSGRASLLSGQQFAKMKEIHANVPNLFNDIQKSFMDSMFISDDINTMALRQTQSFDASIQQATRSQPIYILSEMYQYLQKAGRYNNQSRSDGYLKEIQQYKANQSQEEEEKIQVDDDNVFNLEQNVIPGQRDAFTRLGDVHQQNFGQQQIYEQAVANAQQKKVLNVSFGLEDVDRTAKQIIATSLEERIKKNEQLQKLNKEKTQELMLMEQEIYTKEVQKKLDMLNKRIDNNQDHNGSIPLQVTIDELSSVSINIQDAKDDVERMKHIGGALKLLKNKFDQYVNQARTISNANNNKSADLLTSLLTLAKETGMTIPDQLVNETQDIESVLEYSRFIESHVRDDIDNKTKKIKQIREKFDSVRQQSQMKQSIYATQKLDLQSIGIDLKNALPQFDLTAFQMTTQDQQFNLLQSGIKVLEEQYRDKENKQKKIIADVNDIIQQNQRINLDYNNFISQIRIYNRLKSSGYLPEDQIIDEQLAKTPEKLSERIGQLYDQNITSLQEIEAHREFIYQGVKDLQELEKKRIGIEYEYVKTIKNVSHTLDVEDPMEEIEDDEQREFKQSIEGMQTTLKQLNEQLTTKLLTEKSAISESEKILNRVDLGRFKEDMTQIKVLYHEQRNQLRQFDSELQSIGINVPSIKKLYNDSFDTIAEYKNAVSDTQAQLLAATETFKIRKQTIQQHTSEMNKIDMNVIKSRIEFKDETRRRLSNAIMQLEQRGVAIEAQDKDNKSIIEIYKTTLQKLDQGDLEGSQQQLEQLVRATNKQVEKQNSYVNQMLAQVKEIEKIEKYDSDGNTQKTVADMYNIIYNSLTKIIQSDLGIIKDEIPESFNNAEKLYEAIKNGKLQTDLKTVSDLVTKRQNQKQSVFKQIQLQIDELQKLNVIGLQNEIQNTSTQLNYQMHMLDRSASQIGIQIPDQLKKFQQQRLTGQNDDITQLYEGVGLLNSSIIETTSRVKQIKELINKVDGDQLTTVTSHQQDLYNALWKSFNKLDHQLKEAQITEPSQYVQLKQMQGFASQKYYETYLEMTKELQQSLKERLNTISLVSEANKDVQVAEIKNIEKQQREIKNNIDQKLHRIQQDLLAQGIQPPQQLYVLQQMTFASPGYAESIKGLDDLIQVSLKEATEKISQAKTALGEINVKSLDNTITSLADTQKEIDFQVSQMYSNLQRIGIALPKSIQDMHNAHPIKDPQYNAKVTAAVDSFNQIQADSKEIIINSNQALRRLKELDTQIKKTVDQQIEYEKEKNNLVARIQGYVGSMGEKLKGKVSLSLKFDDTKAIEKDYQNLEKFYLQQSSETAKSTEALQHLQTTSSKIDSILKEGKANQKQTEDIMRIARSQLMDLKVLNALEAYQIDQPQQMVKELDKLPGVLQLQKQNLQQLNDKINQVNKDIAEHMEIVATTDQKVKEKNQLVAKRELMNIQRMAAVKYLDQLDNIYNAFMQTNLDSVQKQLEKYYDPTTMKIMDDYKKIRTYDDTKKFIMDNIYHQRYSPQIDEQIKDFLNQEQGIIKGFLIDSLAIKNLPHASQNLTELTESILKTTQGCLEIFMHAGHQLSLNLDQGIKYDLQSPLSSPVRQETIETESIKRYQNAKDMVYNMAKNINNYRKFLEQISVGAKVFGADANTIDQFFIDTHNQIGFQFGNIKNANNILESKLQKVKNNNNGPSIDDLRDFKHTIETQIIPCFNNISQLMNNTNGMSPQEGLRTQAIRQTTQKFANDIAQQLMAGRGIVDFKEITIRNNAQQLASLYSQSFQNIATEFFDKRDYGTAKRHASALLRQDLFNTQLFKGIIANKDMKEMSKQYVDLMASVFKDEIITKIVDRIGPNVGDVFERLDVNTFAETLHKLQSQNYAEPWKFPAGVIEGDNYKKVRQIREEKLQDLRNLYQNFDDILRKNEYIFQEGEAGFIEVQDKQNIKQQISINQQRRVVKDDLLLGVRVLGKRRGESIYDNSFAYSSFMQLEQQVRKGNPQQIEDVKNQMGQFRERILKAKADDQFDIQANAGEIDQAKQELRGIFQFNILTGHPRSSSQLYSHDNYLALPQEQQIHYHHDVLKFSPQILTYFDMPIQQSKMMGSPINKNDVIQKIAALDLVQESMQKVENIKYRMGDKNFEDTYPEINDTLRSKQLINLDNLIQMSKASTNEEYKEYKEVYDKSQEELIDRIDDIIVQTEQRNNAYGMINQTKQQLGQDFEQMALNQLRQMGLGNYQNRANQEIMYRHLARAGNYFRENGISNQNYEQRKANPWAPTREMTDTRQLMFQGKDNIGKGTLSQEQVSKLRKINLLNKQDLDFITKIIIDNGVLSIKDNKGIRPLTEQEKVKVATIIIDIMVVLMVYELNMVAKDKAQEAKAKLKEKYKQSNDASVLFESLKKLISQI